MPVSDSPTLQSNTNELVDEVLSLIKKTCQEKNITLENKVAKQPQPQFEVVELDKQMVATNANQGTEIIGGDAVVSQHVADDKTAESQVESQPLNEAEAKAKRAIATR